MSTQSFYADLPFLSKFLDLANPGCYAQVPDDWYVLITDITGSTQEIEAGRYREVNILGASSIIAVLNTIRPLEVPFVFGGDGASILVPPSHLSMAREAVLGVRALARKRFAMNLRVGIVPVATVVSHFSLKVAKFRLAPHYYQASFIGGGITYATELVKRDSGYQLDVEGDLAKADLTGLECRWQEIPSPQGKTVSLIVAATNIRGEVTGQVYKDILENIQHICGDEDSYHPIARAPLRLSFNPHKLAAEVNIRTPAVCWKRLQYLARILIENLLGILFMHWNLHVGGVNWGHYKNEVRIASDYQKIDDALRMVIAGNSDQIEQLTHYLEHRFQKGQLAYGLHVSNRALLTCLILDRCNCHFHLVDGADGGYAQAAKALKARLHHKALNWRAYAKLARARSRPFKDGAGLQPFPLNENQ